MWDRFAWDIYLSSGLLLRFPLILYNSKKKVQTSTSNRKKQTKAVVPGSLKDRILKLQTKKQ